MLETSFATLTIGSFIYLALSLIAALPLIGLSPFTYYFSKKSTPPFLHTTRKFRLTNLIINYVWLLLFLSGAVLSSLHYCDTPVLCSLFQFILPGVLIVFIGIPFTLWGSKWIPQYLSEELTFDTIDMLFEAMPLGYNLRYAALIIPNHIIQFKLTGNNSLEGYLTLTHRSARFTRGEVSSPTTTIHCETQLWLDIVNRKVDATQAAIEGRYTIEGNASIMPHFQALFNTSKKIDRSYLSHAPQHLYKEYASLPKRRYKKVVIFYSGTRSDRMSKTYFMVEQLMCGMQKEGASVQLVRLFEKQIEQCRGCYHCWTQTPGQCIHQDDMQQLMNHYRGADLVVFASPLFTFSVNGVMKSFMDRLIPTLQPYMEMNNNFTRHPNREIGNMINPDFVLISAGGFPEVEQNFDGMRTLVKQWAQHSVTGTLRAEILLPASEMLSMPTFSDRRRLIGYTCQQIGEQLVRQGKAVPLLLQRISDPYVSQQEFARIANYFWSNLDGKESYIKYMAKH